mgnify:CR=1 FL=1
MSQDFRLDNIGMVNRNKKISFTFTGPPQNTSIFIAYNSSLFFEVLRAGSIKRAIGKDLSGFQVHPSFQRVQRSGSRGDLRIHRIPDNQLLRQ